MESLQRHIADVAQRLEVPDAHQSAPQDRASSGRRLLQPSGDSGSQISSMEAAGPGTSGIDFGSHSATQLITPDSSLRGEVNTLPMPTEAFKSPNQNNNSETEDTTQEENDDQVINVDEKSKIHEFLPRLNNFLLDATSEENWDRFQEVLVELTDNTEASEITSKYISQAQRGC